MKALLLILPIAGAAWLALGAEPPKPADNSSTSDPPAMSPIAPESNDSEHYDATIGERLARSGSLTTRSERATERKFLQQLNPFAPMEPVPQSPWLSRAAWTTVAGEERASVPQPVETNREVKVRVVVWRD